MRPDTLHLNNIGTTFVKHFFLYEKRGRNVY